MVKSATVTQPSPLKSKKAQLVVAPGYGSQLPKQDKNLGTY